MEELLRLEQVSYSYDHGAPALEALSVTVSAGEKIALVGENGAGKSTFLLCCNGVLAPTSGKIYWQGQPVGRDRRSLTRLRQGVGLVFQDPDAQLLAGTVEEEVSFGPMNLRLSREETAERVDRALAALSLEDFRLRAPQYLSGGEKKRVTLADALAMEPRLLLLDEPASSLDPGNARLLEENLERLSSQGMALMVATHDLDFAWRWAGRVLVFHGGRLERDGTPEEVFGDAELLSRCGLAQPVLMEVGRLLGMTPLPRTIEELKKEWNR